MLFSKTFGYAVRGILYVAIINEGNERVSLDRIAGELAIPRHFLGKVMKKLVKEGVLFSLKGPHGGFYLTDKTMEISLFRLMEITGGAGEFGTCALGFRKCNNRNACPIHGLVEPVRNKWHELLLTTTVGDLVKKNKPDFVHSLVV